MLRDLRREYAGREVVRGVSLEIREGDIFGLLGPNGVGKTTLLSMISTRLRPTSGDAWVYGKHVTRDVNAVRRLLNVAPQEEALYPSLTAAENLSFFAELYGVPRPERARRVADALEAVQLTGRKGGAPVDGQGRDCVGLLSPSSWSDRCALRAAREVV
jgi:ABC-2 type transport system ATP-binding protein